MGDNPLHQGGLRWLRVVWPAVAWVGIEYFRCELAPLAFSFGALGYSQPTLFGFHLASVVGVYGISFVMVLLAGMALELWQTARPHMKGAAVALVIIPAGVAVVPAADIAGEVSDSLGRVLLQQTVQAEDIGSRERLEPRQVEGELDLIVWPELTYTNDPRLPESRWFVEMMQGEAVQAQWGAIFGALAYEDDGTGAFYNSAFFIGSDGEIKNRAGKNQPVQLLADGVPAPGVVVMDMADGNPNVEKAPRAGVGVCYDACFQQFSRRMVSSQADFLVFPTMNLERWGRCRHIMCRIL